MYKILIFMIIVIILFFVYMNNKQTKIVPKRVHKQTKIVPKPNLIHEQNKITEIIKNKPQLTPKFYLITPSLPFDIYLFPDAITHDHCTRLRKDALQKLHKSTIFKGYGGEEEINIRDSMTGLLINDDTLLLQNIASILTGKPLTHIEFVQITKYEKDGKFDYHYDTDPLQKHHPISSRIATLMFYLNDDFEGGDTNFPYIHTTVIPTTSKAIFFYSVLKGQLITDSMHRGNKVISGTKWIANVWIHSCSIEMEKELYLERNRLL